MTDAVANARRAAEASLGTLNKALEQRVERLMAEDKEPLSAKDRHRAIANVSNKIQELTRALSATGNYVANSEINPTSITFANGRTVTVNGHGTLEIGWTDPEKTTPATDREGLRA